MLRRLRPGKGLIKAGQRLVSYRTETPSMCRDVQCFGRSVIHWSRGVLVIGSSIEHGVLDERLSADEIVLATDRIRQPGEAADG